MLCGITLHRMHRARIVLLRGFLPGDALHPRRRARGSIIRDFLGRIERVMHLGTRLRRQIGAPHVRERIGLTDQAGEFSQGIALGPRRCMSVVTAVMGIAGGKMSVVVSISHRDDASPPGRLPTRVSQAHCQMPLTGPM